MSKQMKNLTRHPGRTALGAILIGALLAALLLGLAMPAGAQEQAPEPTIASDKPDYYPGELVTLTGSNWQGDSQVQIFVNDDFGSSWSRLVTVPVVDGNITDSFNLPSWFVAVYTVTATGLDTGRTATTTFTDADYQHWADKTPASWIKTPLTKTNSTYAVGEVVPHYYALAVTNGTTYTIDIYYDFYKNGACGYDRLGQYNFSRTPTTTPGAPLTLDDQIPQTSGQYFFTRGVNITSVHGQVPACKPGSVTIK
jgi:hypothetical protein